MFDADRDGSIDFEEFWYVRLPLIVVLASGADMLAAASGVSSLPGAPSLTALTRTKAGTYPMMSTQKRWLPLAIGFPPPLSIYCIRRTTKVAGIT